MTGGIGTVSEVVDGVYTGELAGPFCYGPGKVDGHRGGRRAGRATTSTAATPTATRPATCPMLEAVGHPVAVNPDRRSASVAHDRGWPIVIFRRRTRGWCKRVTAGVGATALAAGAFAAGVAAFGSGAAAAVSGPRPNRRRRRRPIPARAGSLAGRGPLLRHDADLLRQRRAPHRARLHDGHRRRAGPLAPAARRRRLLPDRHRRARPQGPAGGRGQRRDARRSGPTRPSSASATPGSCSTSPTTTSSAPPSPATTRAVEQLLQACYDNGDIELGTYEGLYCVSCEAYYTEDELVDGNCPIHGRPVEQVSEENYFFKLSRLRAAAARLVRAAPRLRRARGQAQRGPRLHPLGACRTSRSAARRSAGASRCRGTRATSPTSGSTPSPTTSPPSATAPTPSASRTWWPGDATSSARTSCASTACTGRRCCCRPASPRPRRSTSTASCWSAARRCRKTSAQPDRPGRPGRRLRGRRLPLPLPAPTSPSAPTATSPTRAWSPATTPTWPTTSATCCPGRHGGGHEVRRRRPGPAARQPAGRGRRRGLRGRRRGLGRGPAVRGAGRHLAAGPRHQRPPRGQRAVEGRARPGASTRCWATPSRRCASSPSWPRRPCPTRRRPSGSASACRAGSSDQRLPAAAAWGGYPGGLPVVKGDAALPPQGLMTDRPGRSAADRRRAGLDRQPLPPRRRRPPPALDAARGRPGVEPPSSRVGTDAAPPRRRHRHRRRPRRRVGHRRAPSPRRHQGVDAHRRRCSTGPGSSPSASAASTTTTTTLPATCSGRCSPPRSPWPTQHDLPLVIHTREAWDDTFAILAAEGVPARTVFHCFTGGPDEARRVPRPGAYLSFSGIVSFKTRRRRPGRGRPVPARPAPRRDRRPVPGPGPPPGPAATSRPSCPLVGAAVAGGHGP